MPGKTKDFYEVLGVKKSATQEEIKKAYRKLARTIPSGRQPGQSQSGRALQGGLHRLRDPL